MKRGFSELLNVPVLGLVTLGEISSQIFAAQDAIPEVKVPGIVLYSAGDITGPAKQQQFRYCTVGTN